MDDSVKKGYDWFWNNYNNCMGWIQKHEVAYWKSHAMALRAENEEMIKLINNQRRRRPTRQTRKNRKRRTSVRKSNSFSDDLDFELTTEWTQFFKESLDNKAKLKKEREFYAELDNQFCPPQETCDSRQKEMFELYGDGSFKILGMETVMNLEFERYIDRNSPEYWPPLPFNLSAA